VPAEDNRNPARILPGRDDVYIIPRADCTPGFEGDSGVYYSPMSIKACLVLKPPANRAEFETKLLATGRVQCTADYNEKGMTNLCVSPIAGDTTSIDIDKSEQWWSPQITRFTMSVAHPVEPAESVATLHHSTLQSTFSSQQLWLEDVARFKPAEMEAGIVGVEQLLTQAYQLAYYYTTVEAALKICNAGVPAVKSADGGRSLRVCLWPPSAAELGWQSNASGGFKQRVADLIGMKANDVQVVVLLGIPKRAIAASGNSAQGFFELNEVVGGLTFLRASDDGETVLATAHIAKVWTLEATALADARQALVNVRAGKELKDKFEGMAEVEVEREASRLEEDATAAEALELRKPENRRARSGTTGEGERAHLVARVAELEAQLAAVMGGGVAAAEGVPPRLEN
jgi:hypothetical protein